MKIERTDDGCYLVSYNVSIKVSSDLADVIEKYLNSHVHEIVIHIKEFVETKVYFNNEPSVDDLRNILIGGCKDFISGLINIPDAGFHMNFGGGYIVHNLIEVH